MDFYDDQYKTGQYDTIVRQFQRGGAVFPVVLNNLVVFPGFCDVHVHLREPGFFYKESIKSGSAAAAAGGYTSVCAMPNLIPVPDSFANLDKQLEIIKRDAVINVIPYGAITRGENGSELSDMEKMAPYVCAFSDDGRGVQSESVMRLAMLKAAELGKIIAAHCEDNSLLCGGYIHDGEYARSRGHKGISSASEYVQLERDLRLAKETGVKYHVCHISTKESVMLIRRAKDEGVDVSCETAPHYLVLTDADLHEDGRYKMNPPLRSEADRQALIEGIKDGTIDMIATDHAPHSAEEKSRGLKDSLFGITGLETAFPVLYTNLVKTGIISLKRLNELMSLNPRRRFNLPAGSGDYTVFETQTPFCLKSENFISKGRSTPFDGEIVYGKCIATVCGGKTIWHVNSTKN